MVSNFSKCFFLESTWVFCNIFTLLTHHDYNTSFSVEGNFNINLFSKSEWDNTHIYQSVKVCKLMKWEYLMKLAIDSLWMFLKGLRKKLNSSNQWFFSVYEIKYTLWYSKGIFVIYYEYYFDMSFIRWFYAIF